MGISFYYAVRILWRECGRKFLTNVHKIKIPKIQKDLGDFAVWTRLEPALRACLLAISNFDNPSKPPLDRGGLVGREFLTQRT